MYRTGQYTSRQSCWTVPISYIAPEGNVSMLRDTSFILSASNTTQPYLLLMTRIFNLTRAYRQKCYRPIASFGQPLARIISSSLLIHLDN